MNIKDVIRVDTGQGKFQLGSLFIIDLCGVDPKKLNDKNFLKQLLKEAAFAAGAQIIFVNFHHFILYPQSIHLNWFNKIFIKIIYHSSRLGVTGVVGVSESHLAIHTWPEYRYAAVDIFLCSSYIQEHKIEPMEAISLIIDRMNPADYDIFEIPRGVKNKYIPVGLSI